MSRTTDTIRTKDNRSKEFDYETWNRGAAEFTVTDVQITNARAEVLKLLPQDRQPHPILGKFRAGGMVWKSKCVFDPPSSCNRTTNYRGAPRMKVTHQGEEFNLIFTIKGKCQHGWLSNFFGYLAGLWEKFKSWFKRWRRPWP